LPKSPQHPKPTTFPPETQSESHSEQGDQMKSKISHIAGLLAAVLMTDLAGKIALSTAALLGLCFNKEIKGQIENTILGLAGPAVLIASFILLHVSKTSMFFSVLSLIAAVLTNLQKIISSGPVTKVAAAILIFALGMTSVSAARADEISPAPVQEPVKTEVAISPNLLAPPISFCFVQSTTCVMPDFALSVVNYDLGAKKWTGEVQTVGVGYMLLFASDQPYASGIAIHGAGQFQQSGPKYFALLPTLVLARYFEVGATFQFADGAINKFITLGLGFGFDLVSGGTMGSRLQAARLKSATK
jgi:hypothetical protein